MSDSWTIFVPKETGFIPSPKQHNAALNSYEKIFPDADAVEVVLTPGVEFFNCGSNFETVRCPNCQADFPLDWWQAAMDADYVIPSEPTYKAHALSLAWWKSLMQNRKKAQPAVGGFTFPTHTTPCCGSSVSLDQLIYEAPQAFGRFGIRVQNAGLNEVSREQLAAIEAEANCKFIVVYQKL